MQQIWKKPSNRSEQRLTTKVYRNTIKKIKPLLNYFLEKKLIKTRMQRVKTK